MIHLFESARLTAHRIAAEDRDWLLRLHGDAQVMASLGGVRSTEQVDMDLRSYLAHWDDYGFGFWVVTEKSSGERLGRIGLRHCVLAGSEEVELVYTFAASHWGRGFATEICTTLLAKVPVWELPLAEVVAFTTTDNGASLRVMEKLGFLREGEFSDWRYPGVKLTLARFSFLDED